MKKSEKSKELNTSYFKLMWVLLKEAVKTYPLLVFLMIILTLADSGLVTYLLYLQNNIFSLVSAISKYNVRYVANAIIFFFVMRSLSYGIAVAFALVSGKFGPIFDKHIRLKMLNKYSKIRLINYETDEIYNTIMRAKNSCLLATDSLMIFLKTFSGEIMKVIGIMMYFTLIKPELLIVVIIAIIPEFIKMKVNCKIEEQRHKVLTPLERRSQYLYSTMSSKEYLTEAKVLNCTALLKNLWQKAIKKENDEKIKAFKFNLKVDYITNLCYFLSYIIILVMATYYLYKGEISVGNFAVTLTAIGMIRGRVNVILNNFQIISRRSVTIRYYFDFMNLNEKAGKSITCHPINSIRIKNVGFHFDDKRNVLKNINLTINKGDVIAIIGENGAGKTTLVKIILGLLDPSEGNIYYNDQDIANITEKKIFEDTSILFQTFGHYQFSIKENVTLNNDNDEKTVNKVKMCLENAGFKMENNYDINTLLGTDFGGVELSGGQWQQISLARAYYKDSDFIVLDEPTSAIDPIKENELLTNFKEICEGKTAILITHRLSAAKLANKIIFLSKGQIVEAGTHEELMKLSGLYANAYNLQSNWYMR